MAVVIYCVSLFVGVKMISFVGCFAWVYLAIIYLCNRVFANTCTTTWNGNRSTLKTTWTWCAEYLSSQYRSAL